jgi:hypothetical protein
MTGFLPKDVQEELAQAQRQSRRKKATRVVHVGDEAFPILDYSDTGFAVDAEDAPHLRGLIDIYEGATHLTQALIVASGARRRPDALRIQAQHARHGIGADRFRAHHPGACAPADARLSVRRSARFLRSSGPSPHEFPRGSAVGCILSRNMASVHAIVCGRILDLRRPR